MHKNGQLVICFHGALLVLLYLLHYAVPGVRIFFFFNIGSIEFGVSEKLDI